MKPRTLGILQVAGASLCFGFIGVFGKQAFAAGLAVGDLLSLRFLMAVLVLAPVLVILRRADVIIGGRQIALSLGLGVFGYAVFASLYFMAIEGVSVALAALLLYTFPFWTLIFNALLGVRPTISALVGLFTAFIGLLALLWGEFRVESLTAIVGGIGSAITYSLFIIISGRTQQGVPALGSGLWIMVGAALALLLVHRPSAQMVLSWGPDQWTPLLALAIVGTIAPLTLIQAGLRRLPSNETAFLSMLEPVTASVAAALILHESLGARQLVGGTMVLAGLLLVSRKPRTEGAS